MAHRGRLPTRFYSAQDQVIEEYDIVLSGMKQWPSRELVWSPAQAKTLIAYNDLDVQDRETTRFVLQEADGSVTGLVYGDGQVIQRFAYDPQGRVSVFTDTWADAPAVRPGQFVLGAWTYFQHGDRMLLNGDLLYHRAGGVFDPLTGAMVQADRGRFSIGDSPYDPGGLGAGGFQDWFFRNSEAIASTIQAGSWFIPGVGPWAGLGVNLVGKTYKRLLEGESLGLAAAGGAWDTAVEYVLYRMTGGSAAMGEAALMRGVGNLISAHPRFAIGAVAVGGGVMTTADAEAGAWGRVAKRLLRNKATEEALETVALRMVAKQARIVGNVGGLRGNYAVQQLDAALANTLQSRPGWTLVSGGTRRQRMVSALVNGVKIRAFPDIRASFRGKTVFIQTVDTLANGLTPKAREWLAAMKLKAINPTARVLLVPKGEKGFSNVMKL